MKATSGVWGSHFGVRLLRTTALVALALGITLALLFVAGPVEADGPDEFTVPVVLEEGRTPPPDVVDPPSTPEPPQVRGVVNPPSTPEPQVRSDGAQGNGASITQTSSTLIKNDTTMMTADFTIGSEQATSFTTGSNIVGYTLTSVTMGMRATGTVSNYSVSIRADSSGRPGITLGTLTKSGSLPTSHVQGVDFPASGGGIDLAANTTYWLVASENSSVIVLTTYDDNEDGGLAGWSIGDVRRSNSPSWNGSDSGALVMNVKGYAKVRPALTSAEVNGSSLVLNFDRDLNTTSVPAASRFTIEAVGSSHTATGITISGMQVRLTVSAVKAGQYVTVSYRKPGSNPLKGSNGLAVDTFSKKRATNNTPPLAPAPPADTPASGRLISNIGKQVGQVIGPVSEQAQSFTTGSNSFGYRLTSVEMRVNPQSAVSNYSVSIRENSSGIPGTTLGTLNSGQLSTGWQNAGFPASGNGIDLAASSTYWVVASINSDVNMQTTNLDTEDSGGAAGWSMGDGRLFNFPNWDPNNSDTGAIKLAVKGYAKTDPTLISNINVAGGTGGNISEATRAQSFTTGSNSAGYTLTSVEMQVDANGQSSYSVFIYSGDSVPTFKIGTLTNSISLPTTLEDVRFLASGDGIYLVANTKYWLVASASNSFLIGTTTANGEEAGGAAGWRIGDDDPLVFNDPNSSRATTTGKFKFAVTGYAINRLSQRPRDPILVTYTNAEGEEETVENRAASAERDTLWYYFESECTALKEVRSDIYDYSWFNADGHRMMARNGWKWVEVQNANGDVTHTRPMTISECASLNLYQRQQNCASADWLARNPHIHESVCPTYRTW